jgi:hypothetical protein
MDSTDTTRTGATPPRNLQLLAFPIGAAGLLTFLTHNSLISWAFGLSLMAWCVVMIAWLLRNDHGS